MNKKLKEIVFYLLTILRVAISSVCAVAAIGLFYDLKEYAGFAAVFIFFCGVFLLLIFVITIWATIYSVKTHINLKRVEDLGIFLKQHKIEHDNLKWTGDHYEIN